MRFSIFILLLLGALNLQAQTQNILVIGDSLSAAYGIDKNQGWVALLQEHLEQQDLDYHVVNASITGDTTRGGLSRIDKALAKHQPSIVVLELGGNDGLRAFSLRQMRNNLSKMIEKSRAAEAKVLLLGVMIPANYGKRYANQFHQIYHQIADDMDVALVPFFLEGVAETTAMMQPDGIHPNSEAQPIILDNVWEGLEPMLN